jgi:hypothetical protein
MMALRILTGKSGGIAIVLCKQGSVNIPVQ